MVTGNLPAPTRLATAQRQGQHGDGSHSWQMGVGAGNGAACPGPCSSSRPLSARARCQNGLLMALRIHGQGHMQWQCQGAVWGILNPYDLR